MYRKWNEDLLNSALDHLTAEFALPPGVPGGMARYRLALTLSFFLKFYLETANALNISKTAHITEIGLEIPEKLYASQVYQVISLFSVINLNFRRCQQTRIPMTL